MTAIQMIDALGGSTAAADKLGIPMTTVATWKQRNHIPQWRMAGVVTELHKLQRTAAAA